MPRTINRPPPRPAPAATAARREIDAKLRNDGVVDNTEARELVRGWVARPRNPNVARELNDAFRATESRFTPEARATITSFLSSLRLTNPTPINNPGRPGATNTAKLSWDPPTRNTDGSPLTDLAGYKIYYGPSPGNYTKTQTVNDAAASTATVQNLPPGTWYFAVKAFDSAGNLSGFSNEASKTIQ